MTLMISEDFRIIILSLYVIITLLAFAEAMLQDWLQNPLPFFTGIFLHFFLIILVILFGFRDLSIGTDTIMYNFQYINYDAHEFGPDFIMKYFMTVLNLFSTNSIVFFVLMATIYLYAMYFAIKNFSSFFETSGFLCFFSFLSLFFFYNLGINIIRQGVSLSLFLLGISIFLKNRRVLSLVWFFILSIGFHITSLIPFFIVFFILLFKRVKLSFYIVCYFITILLAFKGFSLLDIQDVISTILFDTKFSMYLTNNSIIYDIGFRPQFVAFNTMFLFIFLLIRRFFNSNINYDDLLKAYLGLSSVFFMTFQLPYSDRWGIMSWIFIPILFSPLFSHKFRISTMTVLFFVVIFILFLNNLNQF